MLNRRLFLGSSAGFFATGAGAQNLGALNAGVAGLVAGSEKDQSRLFQIAIEMAAAQGLGLFVPAGTYLASGLVLPAGTRIFGAGRASHIRLSQGETIFQANGSDDLTLQDLQISGTSGAKGSANTGLIDFQNCQGINVHDCFIGTSATNGIFLNGCSGRLGDNTVSGIYGAAIASRNGRGVWMQDNSIADCGNLGIYVERGETGFDGSIVTGNRISGIDWRDAGNGQNGNGINVFRADGVVIANNVLTDCSFSAVRLNATKDCQITGNICTGSGEVAIFSEFGFSGSVVANNIIDNAAQGISITNLDSGGRLAVCNGNIVRNITPTSLTNPDTTPVGIAVEADTVVTGNVVENVPGIGISMGWGPYMRDLNVNANLVRQCAIGIGISVVDGVGVASVTNNLISVRQSSLAITAMAWDEIVEPDLLANAEDYPLITIKDNRVSDWR